MSFRIAVLFTSFALLTCAENILSRQDQVGMGYKETRAAENRLVLFCDNGYDISAIYYAPNSEGILSKLSLKISKAGKTDAVEMIPAITASGAKFETHDGHLSFWEHQGEFTLGIGDKNVSVCRQAINKIGP